MTYATTATQLCTGASGCGVSTQTVGGQVTVTFNPAAGSVVANPTTFAGLGSLVVTCVGGGSACASQSLAGLNLYLVVNQTVPSAGNAAMPGGVIKAAISGTASSAVIDWPVTAQKTIGTITYTITSGPVALIPPATNAGSIGLFGAITDTALGTPPPVYSGLDIDGNGGTADALTDGLLVLRYLFGLRGTALTSGAISGTATRPDSAKIETYLNSLGPPTVP